MLNSRPLDTYGTSLYAVVGREALRTFAILWDETTQTVTVPKDQSFVADVFLYNLIRDNDS